MIRHSNYVSIVSGSTNKVLGNVTVGQGRVSPAFDPNNGNVYVPNFNSNGSPGNTVLVISAVLTPTQGIQQLINTIDSFHLPKVKVYWGTAREFSSELREGWEKFR